MSLVRNVGGAGEVELDPLRDHDLAPGKKQRLGPADRAERRGPKLLMDRVECQRILVQQHQPDVRAMVVPGSGQIKAQAELMLQDDKARNVVRRPPGTDRVLREVDRARRVAGVGPSFPILGYDDLTAAQVNERLGDLDSAQLRKVRDYEKRNANRKSVLNGIESKLP